MYARVPQPGNTLQKELNILNNCDSIAKTETNLKKIAHFAQFYEKHGSFRDFAPGGIFLEYLDSNIQQQESGEKLQKTFHDVLNAIRDPKVDLKKIITMNIFKDITIGLNGGEISSHGQRQKECYRYIAHSYRSNWFMLVESFFKHFSLMLKYSNNKILFGFFNEYRVNQQLAPVINGYLFMVKQLTNLFNESAVEDYNKNYISPSFLEFYQKSKATLISELEKVDKIAFSILNEVYEKGRNTNDHTETEGISWGYFSLFETGSDRDKAILSYMLFEDNFGEESLEVDNNIHIDGVQTLNQLFLLTLPEENIEQAIGLSNTAPKKEYTFKSSAVAAPRNRSLLMKYHFYVLKKISFLLDRYSRQDAESALALSEPNKIHGLCKLSEFVGYPNTYTSLTVEQKKAWLAITSVVLKLCLKLTNTIIEHTPSYAKFVDRKFEIDEVILDRINTLSDSVFLDKCIKEYFTSLQIEIDDNNRHCYRRAIGLCYKRVLSEFNINFGSANAFILSKTLQNGTDIKKVYRVLISDFMASLSQDYEDDFQRICRTLLN